MSDIALPSRGVNGELDDSTVTFPRQYWGATEISRVIRRTPRQTHHLLQRGYIKCAKKVGGRWTANHDALLREFGA
jgi:hypothetical protein